MALNFKTKINKSGNIYSLWVDLDSKILKSSYGCPHSYDDTPYIVITKRKLDELKANFKKFGYKEL